MKIYFFLWLTPLLPSDQSRAGVSETADFVEQSVTKTATRELTTSFADIAALNTVVTSVISTNPFGCTSYEVGGVTMDPVTKTREYYNARVIYEDDDAKTVGYVTVRAPSTAAFATMKSEVLGDAEMAAAMGGDASDDFERDTYSVILHYPMRIRIQSKSVEEEGSH